MDGAMYADMEIWGGGGVGFWITTIVSKNISVLVFPFLVNG